MALRAVICVCAPLLIPTLAPPPAWAGPNSGGVLAVHDMNMIVATFNPSTACTLGIDPGACTALDTRVDAESSDAPALFKIYAIFAESNSPQLLGVSLGVTYDPGLLISGNAPCGVFTMPEGWPASGSGVSIVWGSPQTQHVIPVCAFTAYTAPAGVPCAFAVGANPNEGWAWFGDDYVPAHLDPVADFGRLGFHNEGYAPCPLESFGACCHPDGSCTTGARTDCLPPGIWFAESICQPNPCGIGACCHDGECTISSEVGCIGVWMGEGTLCEPDPCPPSAACCMAEGSCWLRTQADCGWLHGVWHGEWTACDPNPCPQSVCCGPDGLCTLTFEEDCAPPSIWHPEWKACIPENPCAQELGVCCRSYGFCTLTIESRCGPDDAWHPEWTSCTPNPCPQPPIGACCTPGGACAMITESECLSPSVWHPEWTTCTPDPCAVPPPPGGETLPVLGLPFHDTGNTCTYADDCSEPCVYDLGSSPDVVYTYRPAAAEVATIDLCASLFPTELYIYAVGQGVIACNEAACGYASWQSKIESLALTAGVTYYIVVDGTDGSCGAYDLEIYQPAPPTPVEMSTWGRIKARYAR
jgi:hypothetical protein